MELTAHVHSIPAAAGIYAGPLAPNVYLVVDGGEGALIDAGFPDDGSIKARLDYIGGLDVRLTHIILTHHHFDHSSGAHRLREATGARICLHREEERLLRNWRSEEPLDVDIPPERRQMAAQAQAWRRAAAQATPDRLLADGDTIPVGGLTIEVVHTPGHTQGSICPYVREERVLFAGDTVFAATEITGKADFERRPDLLHHAGIHLVQGPVDSRQIEEDSLPTLLGENADDAVAGGLGFVGDDRHLVADQGIQQRALARIGAPHQRDSA